MNSKPITNTAVDSLSWNELGTTLYHIAQRTEVSLDYTERFKRDVLMTVSEALCNAVPATGTHFSEEQFVKDVADFVVKKMQHESTHICTNYNIACDCDIEQRIECDWRLMASDVLDWDNKRKEDQDTVDDGLDGKTVKLGW